MSKVYPLLSPAGGLNHLIKHADAYGTLLLAPESRASTWDVLRGGLGSDVEYMNRALEHTFRQVQAAGSRQQLG